MDQILITGFERVIEFEAVFQFLFTRRAVLSIFIEYSNVFQQGGVLFVWIRKNKRITNIKKDIEKNYKPEIHLIPQSLKKKASWNFLGLWSI